MAPEVKFTHESFDIRSSLWTFTKHVQLTQPVHLLGEVDFSFQLSNQQPQIVAGYVSAHLLMLVENALLVAGLIWIFLLLRTTADAVAWMGEHLLIIFKLVNVASWRCRKVIVIVFCRCCWIIHIIFNVAPRRSLLPSSLSQQFLLIMNLDDGFLLLSTVNEPGSLLSKISSNLWATESDDGNGGRPKFFKVCFCKSFSSRNQLRSRLRRRCAICPHSANSSTSTLPSSSWNIRTSLPRTPDVGYANGL